MRTPPRRDNGLVLQSEDVRELLCKDLPGLPSLVAQGAPTLDLAALATVWLDIDERLAAERLAAIETDDASQ